MTKQRTFSLIGGRVARLTRLDRCGRPVYGNESRLITEGFISIGASANVDEGDDVTVPNANGKIIARRSAKPRHNGWTVEVAFIGVNPFALNITTANPLVLNGAGDVAGFDQDTEVSGADTGWALEVWTDTGEGDVCAPMETERVGYVLFPFLQGGVVGDFSIENDAINFTVSNATSKKGHAWGSGPYVVDVDETGAPTPLAPVPPSVSLRVLEVGLTPPGETDGAVPLDDPTAPVATGATAGTPGAFAPTGAFRPEVLADMVGLTATPTTAWTTGQYVRLQSGLEAHWTGTAWAAGRA
jgi:hypothetical protein